MTAAVCEAARRLSAAKQKKALIDKAFVMGATIGFEPMTLREGLLHNKNVKCGCGFGWRNQISS